MKFKKIITLTSRTSTTGVLVTEICIVYSKSVYINGKPNWVIFLSAMKKRKAPTEWLDCSFQQLEYKQIIYFSGQT